jgi:hypothetical protein
MHANTQDPISDGLELGEFNASLEALASLGCAW